MKRALDVMAILLKDGPCHDDGMSLDSTRP